MAEVSLYRLTIPAWVKVVCKLLEKTYASGSKAFVQCRNQDEAKLLDETLWTFASLSFVPHGLIDSENQEHLRVIIGNDLPEDLLNFDVIVTFQLAENNQHKIAKKLLYIAMPDETEAEVKNFLRLIKLANNSVKYWLQLADGKWSEGGKF